MSDGRSGAPIAVLLDYDGTISLRDVGDELMSLFVTDQAAVAEMDDRYVAGDIGSRDLMAWDMEMLPDDPALLRAHAAQVPQDTGLVELVALCRAHAVPVEVVSDGLGFYVSSNLAVLGLGDLPVATNRNLVSGGAAGVSFPFGHPTCHVCGTCKRERVRAHQAAGRLVVFVGDGPSDRYAAWHADITFAKDSLRAWCESAGVAIEPWQRLGEVTAWLEDSIVSGRLPMDADGVAEWRSQRPARRPPFICGPEAGFADAPGPMDPASIGGLP
jgi:2-hydroxy-3-keto-5-methylthiopentenyl-1-phosphate phosphatase